MGGGAFDLGRKLVSPALVRILKNSEKPDPIN